MIDETANDDDAKKDDAISTSETATPPVQEIRFQSNQFVNSSSSATPTLSVMGYPPPQAFPTTLETGGAIYHTGVSLQTLRRVEDSQNGAKILNFSFIFTHFPIVFLSKFT
jgi:hypothetical protein